MAAYEAAGKSNEWFTPKYIFDDLGLEFDMDVAAPKGGPLHVPCRKYITKYEDGLSSKWEGILWMNPPFGHQKEKRLWLNRFWMHGNGVALLPDRTSAPWWQEYAKKMDCVLFVSPKIKFEREDGTLGNSPGTGTTLFALGRRASSALRRSALGITMRID